MDRYVNTSPTDGFAARYATLMKEKELTAQSSDKESFEKGYKKGSLRLATATRYMKLVNCGVDRFIEAQTNVVWAKEGENIIRVDSDLDWVDELLKQEETR